MSERLMELYAQAIDLSRRLFALGYTPHWREEYRGWRLMRQFEKERIGR